MRKSKPKKRILLPDPRFNDQLVTRFVNDLMVDGKKSLAYKIFYNTMDIVGERMKDSDKTPLEIWKKALKIQVLRRDCCIQELRRYSRLIYICVTCLEYFLQE